MLAVTWPVHLFEVIFPPFQPCAVVVPVRWFVLCELHLPQGHGHVHAARQPPPWEKSHDEVTHFSVGGAASPAAFSVGGVGCAETAASVAFSTSGAGCVSTVRTSGTSMTPRAQRGDTHKLGYKLYSMNRDRATLSR